MEVPLAEEAPAEGVAAVLVEAAANAAEARSPAAAGPTHAVAPPAGIPRLSRLLLTCDRKQASLPERAARGCSLGGCNSNIVLQVYGSMTCFRRVLSVYN